MGRTQGTGRPPSIRLLYPPGMEWDMMVQRPHHLLRLAGEAGWQVTWWETGPAAPPRTAGMNLQVVRSTEDARAAGPYDVVYVTDPGQMVHLKHLHQPAGPARAPQVLVYDRCDLRGPAEIPLLQRAGLVLATTPALAAEAAFFARRVLHLPNAADPDHFAAGRKTTREGPPCIGYMGVLADHLDYPLLAELIRARPRYRWLFAGQEKGGVSLPDGPVVRRLGHVPYHRLPGVLRGVDVGIVPFQDSPLTRAVDPVKIYEYLAAGKPVVAPRLPHLAACDWPVRLARTAAGWLDQIDAALQEGPDFRLGRAWARRHTWRHRFDALAGALTRLLNPEGG